MIAGRHRDENHGRAAIFRAVKGFRHDAGTRTGGGTIAAPAFDSLSPAPAMLSYRHAFHAGNHADVLKHAVLLEVLRYYCLKDKPWTYIDTHAGAGCYALGAEHARQTGEFREGVGRLWGRRDVPELLRPYLAMVHTFNPDGDLAVYPGSPAVAMSCLRPADRMRLFELHPTDAPVLADFFRDEQSRVKVERADGFAALAGLLPPPSRRAVVLVDPPYEVKTDYRQVAEAVAGACKRFATGTYLVWYPLLQRPEARHLPERLMKSGADSWLRAELAVSRPPREGIGMYGSGLFVVNPPWNLPERLGPALAWLAGELGQAGEGSHLLEARIP
jgi:23S rRNA (adenine2030-N6)-methyltransferase